MLRSMLNGSTRLRTGPTIGKASDWMEDTMGRRPVLVRLPSLTIGSAEAVREIFRFELEVMAAVVTKLRSDVRQLQRFQSDSESVRQQKWQVVQEEGDRITRVKDQARRDSDAE